MTPFRVFTIMGACVAPSLHASLLHTSISCVQQIVSPIYKAGWSLPVRQAGLSPSRLPCLLEWHYLLGACVAPFLKACSPHTSISCVRLFFVPTHSMEHEGYPLG